MKQLLLKLYLLLPKNMIDYLGKASWLKFVRNLFLRKDGQLKITAVRITKTYDNLNASFLFNAPIRLAAKAKKAGIETIILTSSVKLLLQLQGNAVIFDIGANYGFLSLVWATTVSRNGKIYAFEPDTSTFKIFESSIALNNLISVIQPEHAAAGSIKKESMITIDGYVQEKNITQCNFIKIDVDGLEYEILQGCENTIQKFRPMFAVELNNDERIITFFITKNYQLYDVALQPFDSIQQLPANIFCIAR